MVPIEPDVEGELVALSVEARWLLNQLDGERIAERAVESLADFGRSDRVGLFLFDDEGVLQGIAGYVEGVSRRCAFPLPLSEAWHERLIVGKNQGHFPLAAREGIPFPAPEGLADRHCLAAPLIAANNRVIGVATFDHPVGFALTPMMSQSLALLLTLTAIALETARLFKNVVTDGLTGLYVRRYFDHRLAEEARRIRRYGGQVALLMLDIDHFKHVNDTYGHPQGDEVLRQIAAVIGAAVRQEVDAPCRFGGEEFVAILPDTDPHGAVALAERIRQRVAALRFPAPTGPFQVTISGGVASMDRDTMIGREELLRRADEALYRAKSAGRNRICVGET